MIGGLKQTTSRLAIAAAAGMFAGGIALTPAQAADLGGDCCADLEERVAELEATTVRKGNRKVSLKLSGHVIRQVLWWDDGHDSDVYFTDGGVSNTRFALSGSGKISEGRTAGFYFEHDYTVSNDPSCLSNPTGITAAGKVSSCTVASDRRQADIWVKDDQLGKLSWGRGNTASNGIAEIDLSGTGIINDSTLAGASVGAFTFRTTAGGGSARTVGSFFTNLDGGSRNDRVRYDTPTFGGFTLSGSVWADDNVDIALRYAKEWNSVRCAMGIATVHQTAGRNNQDNWQTSGSISCIHTPSGLNLTYAAGSDDESDPTVNEREYWWIKAGISRRWNSHGKTSIAVAYGEYDDITAVGDDSEYLGVSIVQAIDSAAMEVFGGYYNFEASRLNGGVRQNLEDIESVIVGGRIKF